MLSSALAVALLALASTELINSNVERVVDISTQIAKASVKVEVSNTGSSAVSKYRILAEQQGIENVAFVGVTEKGKDLPVKRISKGVYEAAVSLSAGSSTILSITLTYTHVLEPFPKAINQPDNQLVRYTTNCYFYSPYSTTTQTSRFTLGSSKIESYTPRSPSAKEGTGVKYGPYADVAAKANSKIIIHFENNSPFLTVTNLKRIIEVSHWGNIAVEEHYEVTNAGAKLKSQFSRLDFQRNPIGAPTAIKSFRTVLPASSHNVYYRDDIGNISTSNLRETEDANELEIRPRFPLFGGWKTRYYIGYNVPSYEMLSYRGNLYKLEFPFVDHSFDNLVIDKVEVQVLLPEGSNDFEVKYPAFEVERSPDSRRKTYLDTSGRQVLTFTASNLEENHIQNIEIYYKFNSIMLLQEPLLVVIAFMAVFLTVIIFVRLDFSISVDENREARQKVAYLVEEVSNICNRIKNSVSDEMIDLVGTAKTNKDMKAFKNSRKEIEGVYKQLQVDLGNITKKITSFAPTLTDKIIDLNKKEGERKAVITSIAGLAEKAASDKINVKALNEQLNGLSDKLSSVQGGIDDIITLL